MRASIVHEGHGTNPKFDAVTNSDVDTNLPAISIFPPSLETSPVVTLGLQKGGREETGHPLRLLFFLRPNEIRTEPISVRSSAS